MAGQLLHGIRPLLVLVACLWLSAASVPAFAHAQLLLTQPQSGAVLDAAPREVRLEFNEPVSPVSLKWFGPDGAGIALSPPKLNNGSTLAVTAPADLAEGSHLLSYRVTSIDGHVISGSLPFAIGAATANPPGGTASDSSTSARRAAIGRYALTLCLTLAVGGAIFFTLLAAYQNLPRWPRILARLSAFAGLFAALLAMGLQGLDLTGEDLPVLLTQAPYLAARQTSFVWTSGLAFVACLLAIEALGRRGSRAVAVLAWIFATASFAASGHAATASPQWLMRPAVAIHAAAFLYWIGVLPGLLAVSIHRPANENRILARFSKFAVPLVVALAATGAAIAIIQVESVSYLWSSTYGYVLIAKIAMFGILLLLAALNRLVLSPDMAKGEGSAARRLSWSIRSEILIAVIVLAAASSFRLTPPPRALAAADRAGVSTHIHQEQAIANVTARPGRRGENRITLDILNGDATPMTPKEVTLAFERPDLGVEPIKIAARRDESGAWVSDPVPLTASGPWRVTVAVLVSDFAEASLKGQLDIRD